MSSLMGGGSGTRDILRQNTNYYVTTSGNDNNPGTLAKPWATLQHAMSFIAGKVDIAGFIITVNIGAGTFVGFGSLTCVGGGAILFLGSGTASTIIGPGPVDGVINFGECFDANFGNITVFYFDALAFAPDPSVSSSYAIAIYVQNNGIILGTPFAFPGVGIKYILPAVGGAVCFGAFANGDQQINNPQTIDGTGAGAGNFFADIETGANLFISAHITLVGTPDFVVFIQSVNNAWIVATGAYTGAATGRRFDCLLNSNLSNIPGRVNGPNYFPGNTPGRLDASSSYDGIPGSNVNYSVQITGFSLTLGNTDTEVIIDPAGTIAAGTIVMQPLPEDGQKVRIRTSQIITSLTINGNAGQTIKGYATGALPLGGVLEGIFQMSNMTWYF